MKHFFPLFFCFLLLVPSQATAQNFGKLLKTTLKSTLKKVTIFHSAPAPVAAKAQNAAAIQLFSQAAADEQTRLRLNSAITRQMVLRAPLPANGQVFRAVSAKEPDAAFSGTVFSVTRNGKEEIYGAISTHAISDDPNDIFGLQRRFIAVMYDQHAKPFAMEAEIVAASPVSMLDIALVKFPDDKTHLLKPYRLAQARNKETLHSLGFNRDGFIDVPNRQIMFQTPSSIRTTMPLSPHRRPGLCGGAVLNEREELVGIHTGTTAPTPYKPECAYATPSLFLNYLIDAYHQGEKGTVPFFIRPGQSIRLQLNEYIVRAELLDAGKTPLAETKVNFRFSYSKLQQALADFPQAKFMRISTQEVSWEEDGSALVVNRDATATGKIYLYDLAAGKLLSVSAKH